jgi:hypothetical protein
MGLVSLRSLCSQCASATIMVSPGVPGSAAVGRSLVDDALWVSDRLGAPNFTLLDSSLPEIGRLIRHAASS